MSAQRKADTQKPLGAGTREKLGRFIRTLRDNGFIIGLAETRDALVIMSGASAARATLLRPALRTLFCSRASDWQKFEEIFDAFWLNRGMKSSTKVTGAPQKTPHGLQQALRSLRGHEAGLNADHVERGEGDNAAGGQSKNEGASRAETFAKTDFRYLTQPEDLSAAHEIAARLASRMRVRLTRRFRAARGGLRLDLRRTIHKSIAYGGIPLELVHKRRKNKPLRLVVLLDASGSMSLYSAVFLRFIHGVLASFREAEAFVFHTKLIHISPALRERNAERAVERMTLLAQGVGGGTRIGESLATFNRWHAKRVIHSRSCLMIVSDGYDTGPAPDLGIEMSALRKRCRRIVWLNPMIGWQDYSPAAAGMQAALPYIDLFAPAHNLASLQALEPYLAKI